jgi:hypothetical protein
MMPFNNVQNLRSVAVIDLADQENSAAPDGSMAECGR